MVNNPQGSFIWNDNQDSFNSFESDPPPQINFMGFNGIPQQAEGIVNLSEESSPLGLTLRKTPSFLNLIETKLFQGKTLPSTKTNQSTDLEKSKDDSAEQREKWKASNFNGMLLKIGTWERVSKRDGDVVAKCYYSKRKLVWEILEGGLKSKLEVQFSDISAMRALFPANGHETLEIELRKAPIFFGEINPQPRKHTIWQTSSDFTGGQATLNRRHYLQFAKGTLWRHYERLLQCDERLFTLSRTPFPSFVSPYFHFNFGGGYQDSPSEFHGFQQPQSRPTMHVPTVHHVRTYDPRGASVTSMDLGASPMSVMEFPPQIEEHQRTFFSDQRPRNVENVHMTMENQVQESPLRTPHDQVGYFHHQHRPSTTSPHASLLNDIAAHLLYDPAPPACSDEQLMARVQSMASLLQLQNQQTAIANTSPSNIHYNDRNPNHSALPTINNQSYGDGTMMCQESVNWHPGLVSVEDETQMNHLSRNSSPFSYVVSNQVWDDPAGGVYYQ